MAALLSGQKLQQCSLGIYAQDRRARQQQMLAAIGIMQLAGYNAGQTSCIMSLGRFSFLMQHGAKQYQAMQDSSKVINTMNYAYRLSRFTHKPK